MSFKAEIFPKAYDEKNARRGYRLLPITFSLRPDYRATYACFGKKARSIVVHYREICEFTDNNPD
jgi:hypothetical protein